MRKIQFRDHASKIAHVILFTIAIFESRPVLGETLSFIHQDHLGSASLITDSEGNNPEKRTYYPFGAIEKESIIGHEPNAYNDKDLDAKTKLYNFEARMYAAQKMHFISADTIVPDETDPQNWNRYAYVLNNPMKYVDPTGHFSEEAQDHVFPKPQVHISQSTDSDASYINVILVSTEREGVHRLWHPYSLKKFLKRHTEEYPGETRIVDISNAEDIVNGLAVDADSNAKVRTVFSVGLHGDRDGTKPLFRLGYEYFDIDDIREAKDALPKDKKISYAEDATIVLDSCRLVCSPKQGEEKIKDSFLALSEAFGMESQGTIFANYTTNWSGPMAMLKNRGLFFQFDSENADIYSGRSKKAKLGIIPEDYLFTVPLDPITPNDVP